MTTAERHTLEDFMSRAGLTSTELVDYAAAHMLTTVNVLMQDGNAEYCKGAGRDLLKRYIQATASAVSSGTMFDGGA